jgi:hypothetical protein
MPLNPIPDRGPIQDRVRPGRNTSQGPSFGALSAVAGPGPEMNITQEIRQAGYEGFTTSDDHLMHLTRISKDQNGIKYYKTKIPGDLKEAHIMGTGTCRSSM